MSVEFKQEQAAAIMAQAMDAESKREQTAAIVAQTAVATAKAVFEAAQATAKVMAAESASVVTSIALLNAEVTLLKTQVGDLGKTFDKIWDKLNEIALGRPTWAVSIIIGLLTSVVVGLVVFTISHLG